MTSIKMNDHAYVPFWVLLEFLDVTPPDPFVRVRVLSSDTRRFNSPNGVVEQQVADLEIKAGLIAPAIPLDYLIAEDELKDWAKKISDWFLNYSSPNK